jgi:DNA-binding NtrC family response regulator
VEVVNHKSENADGHSVASPPAVSIKTILLVDDARGTRLMTKWFLDYVGFVVHACSNPEDALARFDPKIHDLVVTENSMAPMTGAEMAHIIKMRSPNTPVLMYTGAPPADRSCLDAMIQKPAPLPALKAEIDKLLTARS